MIIYVDPTKKPFDRWIFLNTDTFGIVMWFSVDNFALKWKSPK